MKKAKIDALSSTGLLTRKQAETFLDDGKAPDNIEIEPMGDVSSKYGWDGVTKNAYEWEVISDFYDNDGDFQEITRLATYEWHAERDGGHGLLYPEHWHGSLGGTTYYVWIPKDEYDMDCK